MTANLTPDSTLFDALMRREDFFGRLLAYDGRFAKFHRVLVNESMAQRLSLADAAAILGLAADDLLALARGEAPHSLREASTPRDRPEVLDKPCTTTIDTWPMFEDGQDPLGVLLDAAEALPTAEALRVKAPFHPVPLRRLLARRALASHARHERDVWEVVFARLLAS